MQRYFYPPGDLQKQKTFTTSRAIFTESYMVMPASVMRDIVTSSLPFWQKSRFWILARPLSGFAETFSQYIAEIETGGGSKKPEVDRRAESAIFIVDGRIEIVLQGKTHVLEEGGFAYIPPNADWQVKNSSSSLARFHWIRKAYEKVEGLGTPQAIFTTDEATVPALMPGYESVWMTTRFMDMADLRHDMNVAIVTFMPGGRIPFTETHVMEHGLYVLQGQGVYRLNNTWIEVAEGDFMWLRAFCPQACYAGGSEPFRYLLYKDINRHAHLWKS
ncbi:MAG: (S)-ureidoglycine aminohydrolase [Candidatus Tokpelaia sp. JSC085]|nr:MAG: (S)-ureidoglycine aminohydrolase [Candidatus Tokpelaia sp. JSC085]